MDLSDGGQRAFGHGCQHRERRHAPSTAWRTSRHPLRAGTSGCRHAVFIRPERIVHTLNRKSIPFDTAPHLLRVPTPIALESVASFAFSEGRPPGERFRASARFSGGWTRGVRPSRIVCLLGQGVIIERELPRGLGGFERWTRRLRNSDGASCGQSRAGTRRQRRLSVASRTACAAGTDPIGRTSIESPERGL